MALTTVKRAAVASRTNAANLIGARRNRIFTVADKNVRKILNERLANLRKLETFRLRQQQRITDANRRYLSTTENVLNKKTLDFLVQHSNIDVPTTTSIFAGFALARASRAERSNAQRKNEVDRLNAEIALETKRLESSEKLSEDRIKLIQDGLDRNLKALDTLQKASNEDIDDINRSNLELFKTDTALEREEITSENRSDLQRQRDIEANQRNRNTVAGANSRNANTIEAQNERTEETNASRERAARIRASKPTAVNRQGIDDFLNGKLNNTPGINPVDSFFDEPAESDEVDPVVEPTIDDEEDSISDAVLEEALIDRVNEDPIDPLPTDEDVLVGDQVVENGDEISPVIGEIFESREQFDLAVAEDNTNEQTVDISNGLEESLLIYYENPDTGAATILAAGEEPPEGFIALDEGFV